MRRKLRRILGTVSLVLPFALPVLVLVAWLSGRCDGQDPEPLHIVASVDPDGGRTTIFSTIAADGNEAVWTCSSGDFLESGDRIATGRTVTWQPESDFEDSVSVVITTPSLSDTVRFLPVIPDMTPSLSVSAAYHLALLERARTIQLPPGSYTLTAAGEGLRNYDGLTILIVDKPEAPREALAVLPGDTLTVSLPLGGSVTATGLDTMEGALDNAGSIQVTFEECVLAPDPETETATSDEPSEDPAPL